MATLGSGGVVTLEREVPSAIALSRSRLTATGVPKFNIDSPEYDSGMRVTLCSALGLPLDRAGSAGWADSPDGHGFYGGAGERLGPATHHRTNDASPFYSAFDSVGGFYDSESSTGFTQFFDCYVHRDELDRLSFYSSEIDAINGQATGLLTLMPIGFGALIVAPYGADPAYRAELLALASVAAAMPPADGEAELSTVAEPDPSPWKQLCELGAWVLETDPTMLDTTAIGEEFGDSAKSVLRGAGSFNSFIGRSAQVEEYEGEFLLRASLLLRKGSKAKARFRLANQAAGTAKIPGELYYWTNILIGKAVINTRPREYIGLSVDFVSVGEIKLLHDATA